ncbi:hypothetical protein PCANC_11357 [Puccinia coronata f. sp. avenae]|uniref:Uncharacterized protein n=1 Tax=Puccinia coronata f. sp. avenae TaxID=200324 RepID=A0A2N5VT22_9BASI|nr:hypothetical protein PCANC_11357 [Puccinia coronata f. sp. avenae]
MQKAIPNLLLIVLTFVIICRAELDSEFLQDFCFSNDNWSGVDNQKLLQIIYKSKSPGTDQPYPSSHTSTTRERSTGRPNPGELDDIGSTPIEPTFSCPVSSQPVPVISNTPVNSAAAISTPTYLDHHLKNDHPVSKKLKFRKECWGQVKNCNNEIAEPFEKTVRLLDYIHMHEKEMKFSELVFDKDVFKFPDTVHLKRKRIIEDIISKNEAENNSNPPGIFLINSEAKYDFILAFNSIRGPNPKITNIE